MIAEVVSSSLPHHAALHQVLRIGQLSQLGVGGHRRGVQLLLLLITVVTTAARSRTDDGVENVFHRPPKGSLLHHERQENLQTRGVGGHMGSAHALQQRLHGGGGGSYARGGRPGLEHEIVRGHVGLQIVALCCRCCFVVENVVQVPFRHPGSLVAIGLEFEDDREDAIERVNVVAKVGIVLAAGRLQNEDQIVRLYGRFASQNGGFPVALEKWIENESGIAEPV